MERKIQCAWPNPTNDVFTEYSEPKCQRQLQAYATTLIVIELVILLLWNGFCRAIKYSGCQLGAKNGHKCSLYVAIWEDCLIAVSISYSLLLEVGYGARFFCMFLDGDSHWMDEFRMFPGLNLLRLILDPLHCFSPVICKTTLKYCWQIFQMRKGGGQQLIQGTNPGDRAAWVSC